MTHPNFNRAGSYIQQPTGYKAFIPAPLPPSPPIDIDMGMVNLLSRADQAVARLDGVALTLPNPDLFVAMYVRQEAVLSSQIEGTISTLDDVLAYEFDVKGKPLPQDVEEVVNYVKAMNYGLGRLQKLPLSLRLIREIHAELLTGVRGSERSPGEFRTSQNWIGPENAILSQATFVPPPPSDMQAALGNLESFLHDEHGYPGLIHCGIAHAQFETIHPFLDGNGRVGRLLITFLLCHKGILKQPLLYISAYLKRHRAQYYDRLMAVREDGDWESWLNFFLQSVYETAEGATATAHAIIQLQRNHRTIIQNNGSGAVMGLRLLDLLFFRPLISVRMASQELGVAYVTASQAIESLASLGIVEETTGRQRNRIFRYSPYLRLFEQDPREVATGPLQSTSA